MNQRRTSLALLPLILLACEPAPTTPKADPATTATPTSTTTAKATASAKTMTPKRLPQLGPKPIPAPADVAAAPKDAAKTDSGLMTKVLTQGTGKTKPQSYDSVSVHYTGWTTDGKMFDSSVARKSPAKFPVNGVIKGWTEALQLMVEGEKRRLWIPAKLAYGEKPMRPGAPAGNLTFDVELLKVIPGPKPPPVPEDLQKPPADAIKTKSGLVYRYLKHGKGTTSPKANDMAKVDYSGWTKDGNMFDSSITRGRPASFQVSGVIKGWTEALQRMKEGDKLRLWIPADLAYGEKPKRPGAPAGELVFDVELLQISSRAKKKK